MAELADILNNKELIEEIRRLAGGGLITVVEVVKHWKEAKRNLEGSFSVDVPPYK